MFINLDTITKTELETLILCEKDLQGFYDTLDEEKFLWEKYTKEELSSMLLEWMEANDECK
jgi:hypothetical protein|tara:strand:- start:975 stop:1157 length:183 start_codon:yes stop_codon:yes gene_type:complete